MNVATFRIMKGRKAIMYHFRLSGSHYYMGYKLGTSFIKNNVKFPILLDEFQIKHGQSSGLLLKQYFPEAYEEICGITDAYCYYDKTLFLSWMMCMGCCMYNLEQSQSVEVRGCTAYSFTSQGCTYYSRNNDLPPYFKKSSKSILYQFDDKNEFILNTSSFVNGEEGMNNSGLSVAMTFVMPKLEEIVPGLNSVFLVRYLIEKCKTVEDALSALKRLPIASSCNILLSDKSGNMLVAECHPNEISIRMPEISEDNEKYICTVNSFTSNKMRKYNVIGLGDFFSRERYMTVMNAFKSNKIVNPISFSVDLLSGKNGFICQYPKKMRFGTVWSSIFELNTLNTYCTSGDPRHAKFHIDERLMKLSKYNNK